MNDIKAFVGTLSFPRWKTFIISFLAVFLMVLLPKLGVHFGSNDSQAPAVQSNIIDTVRPKLQQFINKFTLKTQSKLLLNSVYAGEDFDQAKAYLALDFDTGEVLAAKNSDQVLPVASLTKIMTAMVSLDLAKPTDLFTVSKNAESIEPTRIGVVAGQKMSAEELLHAMLITSANDAAKVLQEGIDQKYESGTFVKAMNEKAKFLGLEHTNFDNPEGFDGQNNFSSAEDLAIISHYALTYYPIINQIVKEDYHFLPADNNHKQFDLYNWNGLLDVYPGAMGVKIGNTDKAQITTIVLSERVDPKTSKSKKIMVIVLGAPTILARDLWASQLLDLGFSKTLGLDPVQVTQQQLEAKYRTWKYWG